MAEKRTASPAALAEVRVSPARSIDSETHIEMTGTLNDMHASFELRMDERMKTMEESISRRLEAKQEKELEDKVIHVIEKRYGVLIDLGTDVLMRCLEDMVLEKMREYTGVDKDLPYAQQIELFVRRYSSVLSDSDTAHLSHSYIRRNANSVAHFSRGSTGVKKYMDFLSQDLANTDEYQQRLCDNLLRFVFGDDSIRAAK
jgi:hypothetical protein